MFCIVLFSYICNIKTIRIEVHTYNEKKFKKSL
nr:MAG TPA: hypothetical protein [Caudoviricetes sp.]